MSFPMNFSQNRQGHMLPRSFGGEFNEAINLQNEVVQKMHQPGQAIKMKPLAEKSIAIRQRLEGENSLLAATAYLTLGQVEMELGNYERAFELCDKSAKVRDSFPNNEHDAACARDDAARALEGQGKLKEARVYRMGGPNAKQGIVCGSTPCSKFAKSYEKYLTCGQCRSVWYCNKTCQRQDWKRHKKFCKPTPVS